MSLNQQFFIDRDSEIKRREALGERELESFLKQHDLTAQQLMVAGLLCKKQIASTADLYDYQLTDAGGRLMKEIKRFKIIVIKREQTAALLDALKQEYT
jgi:hypothetical protein